MPGSFPTKLLLLICTFALGADGTTRQEPRVPIVAMAHDTSLDSFGEHSAASLGDLKRSVFRITVYRKVWRWSRPFDDHYVVGSLGSGFLVGDSPLTICTCAHVVRGADLVYLQVTDFGKTRFEAQVETINNYADVAMITLKKPEELVKKLAEANVKLIPLKFAEKTAPLGHNVVAPGFPLGQETMTLSTGVISGVDHVSFHYTNLATQSTAIISSGNSGSPLLDADSMEVIGMNYAKQTSEAQINYVVALWRLKQVVVKHKQVQKEKGETPYQFKLVEPGLVLTPGVDAFYMLSQSSKTCNSGPLISSVLPNSPFRDAEPTIPENSFLVSVDGIKLDKYGQGTKKEYVDEMVDFSDLMWMRGGTGEEEIAFETCNAATGNVQKHKTSMAWKKEREGQGVQYVYDARLDKLEWEIFGELIFMPLTENHISLFSGDFHSNAMIRFLDPEERQKPRLAVMLLKGGGEAQDALNLMRGSDLEVVESINGHKVKDLEDYRQHFFPDPQKKSGGKAPGGLKLLTSNSTRNWPQGVAAPTQSQSFLRREHRAVQNGEELVWSLKTSAGKEYASLFVETLKAQESQYTSGARHMMTLAAKEAMAQLGFFDKPKKKSLLATPQGIAQRSAVTELDIDTAKQLTGEPLEVMGRDGGVAILDFARNEGYDSW